MALVTLLLFCIASNRQILRACGEQQQQQQKDLNSFLYMSFYLINLKLFFSFYFRLFGFISLILLNI